MNVPSFLKLKDNSLLFNEDGEFLFYVPETYFGETKNPIAQIIGQYVTTLGILDWAIVSKNGTVGEAHPFKFPTIFMCKPNSIEKVKNLKLNNTSPKDYRILHFKKGDEVISDITQEVKEPFKFDRAKILSEIENALGMNFIPYKSTPGLYKTDSKPALFHLGITRKHITLYCKGASAKKIEYSDSYIDDIIKALN